MGRHYDFLAGQFPGQALISLVDAGTAIGMAAQTARNKVRLGEFPTKTIKIGGRRMVSLIDLAEYLDAATASERKTRGRPRGSTKAARIEAAQAGAAK